MAERRSNLLARGSVLIVAIAIGQNGCTRADRSSHDVDATHVSHWLPAADTTPIVGEQRYTLHTQAYRPAVGVDPASELLEFAGIRDGVLMSPDLAVVTDLGKRRVVAVDLKEGRAALVMGNGAGPGELVEPTFLFQHPNGVAEVWDNGLKRSTALHHQAGNVVVSDTVMPFDGQPSAGCSFGSSLAILAYDRRTERLFQSRHRDSGEWGLPLLPGTNALNAAHATDGRLLCEHKTRRLLFVPLALGIIVAYDSTGTVLWQRRIPDFLPTGIDDMGGVIRYRYAPSPANRATVPITFLRLTDSLALLQLGNQTRSIVNGRVALDAEAGIESRLVRLVDGAEVGRQDDVPRVLAALGSHLLLTGQEPEPWIEVRRFNVRPSTAGQR